MIGRGYDLLRVATTGVVALVLMMMNLCLLSANVFNEAVGRWGRGLEMTVYLNPRAEAAAVKKMEASARASGDFAEVQFVSAERATELLLKSLGGNARALLDDPQWVTPLPPTFELRLSDRIQPLERANAFRRWDQSFREAGVATDVFFGEGWIEDFSNFVGGARAVFFGFWLLSAVVGLLIIGNCVRLTFQLRQEEIEILELLGATKTFIRRPFLREGLGLGLTASLLSLGLSGALHAALLSWGDQLGMTWFQFQSIPALSPTLVMINLATGAGFGWLGAWTSVRRLNTGWAAAA